MIKDDSIRFKLNVSVDTYKTKDEAKACLSRNGAKSVGKKKMAFKESEVTTSEFIQLATTGHTFCNLFSFDPNWKYRIEKSDGGFFYTPPVYKKGINSGAMKLTFKSDQYFRGSQVIFVDIDFTRYMDIEDYISHLTYQPTCVYMSFSDMKDKGGVVSRRFRLVYVLDRIVGRDEFCSISQSINDRIVYDTAEPMDDDCGTRMSQYFNGVYGNDETYCTDNIYSPSDFTIAEDTNFFQNTTEENVEVKDNVRKIEFDKKMLWDMEHLDYQQFMHYYSTKYRYFYRTERGEWIDDTYQLTDDDYLQLFYFREKQYDMMKRRRKLGKNACLRRLMYPDVDENTLLFNLYVDRERFFDNSDGVLSIDTLERKVRFAMEMNTEQLKAFCNCDIEYWKENRQKFICKTGTHTTKGMISSIKKRIRWRELDDAYDRSISVKENMKKIDVSKSTLYRYCLENDIDTNPNGDMTARERRELANEDKREKIAMFLNLYDPETSLTGNIEVMRDNGLEIAKTTMHRWLKEYWSEKDETDTTKPTMESQAFTAPDFDWFGWASNYSRPTTDDGETSKGNQIQNDSSPITSPVFPKFCWNMQ